MASTKSKRPAARPQASAKPRPRPKAKKPHSPDVDASLFQTLTEGERAAALRILTEDERVRATAKIGRYRVISVEPLVLKHPDELASHRLARVVLYDYAADVCIDACVDLDAGVAARVMHTSAQPALSVEEEVDAIAVARRDTRVAHAAAGAEVVSVLHYWSRRETDVACRRRSAAVVFGTAAGSSLVVVVDLLDGTVAEVVPASQW